MLALARSRATLASPSSPTAGVKPRRRGAAALEFAVVANVLLITILGCIEFSRVVMVRGLAEDAAYEAARHVVVPGATIGEANAVVSRLLSAMRVSPGSVEVHPYDGTKLQTQVDEKTSEIRVRVTIPISNICFFTPRFVLGNHSIVTSCRLFTERYHGYYDGSSGT